MKALHIVLLAAVAATSLLAGCDKREGAGGTAGTSGSGTTSTSPSPPMGAASPASR